MLIKTTLSCKMSCSHCMESATPSGEHMSMEMFMRALDFTERAECEATRIGIPMMVMLSGGECTDNPLIVEMASQVIKRGWILSLLTHGLWLDNVELRNELLRDDWPNVMVQVTNDDRYYPRKPPKFEHPKVHYVDRLLVLSTIGRASRPTFDPKGLNPRIGPGSFNFRSMTHSTGSVPLAIRLLRVRGCMGKSGFCTPSVTHEGIVVAGESRFCYPIGTVDSSNEELTAAVLSMGSCNRCGQEANLPQTHKHAIGIREP
jgi:hypothetical protein